jgi:hypothetical protein
MKRIGARKKIFEKKEKKIFVFRTQLRLARMWLPPFRKEKQPKTLNECFTFCVYIVFVTLQFIFPEKYCKHVPMPCSKHEKSANFVLKLRKLSFNSTL